MGIFVCSHFTWFGHHLEKERALSRSADLWICSCGKKYAFHKGMGITIPFDSEAENLYKHIGYFKKETSS